MNRTKALIGTAAILASTGTIAMTTSRGREINQADILRRAIDGGRARNVILFLGDGMGDSEITIARNYQAGADGRLWLDTLPLTGAYTTYALQESNPSLIDYVTDSAASGTGWATGVKTSNGRISSVAGTGNAVTSLPTILEHAQRAGFLTGNVSTAEITDATPAVLNAHINERGCQGPADMSACGPSKKDNGGPGSIAEQSVDHMVNVLLGGGRGRFAQTVTGGAGKGKTVIQYAQSKGYTYVDNAAALEATSASHVLGLFNNGNMSLEWSGLQAIASPGSGLPAGQVCSENQRPSNEPSLAAMTSKAIDLLDDEPGQGSWREHGENENGHRRKRGFFLQVEGASIDKQDHVERPCEQIGETVAFDRAVRVGLEYARRHPDTLIIVTADHAHTSQIVPVPSVSDTSRPGTLSTLLTGDRSLMTVSYGTRAHGQSQDHTGAQVRIAAQGPQAASVVGVTNQTDLFHTIARALGLE